jgi:phosphatidate cytidylyltransferase
MAFNWQTFRIRALSAIVFVILMLVGLLWNHWSFLALFSFIHFGCWIEYKRLVEKIDPKYADISAFHRYGVMLAGWGFMLWMTNDAYTISDVKLSNIGFWMLVIGAVAVNVDTIIQRRGKLIAHSLMGLLYISLSLGLVISLGSSFSDFVNLGKPEAGSPPSYVQTYLPILVLACMWINDTMAYIVGSLIGKTPFSKISPKKTWEGTVGGIVLCTLIIALLIVPNLHYSSTFNLYMPDALQINWYGFAAIAAIFGTLGDLFESKLKRLAGVKDSGQMMPGHGGFLDRFDSLLLATPFVWLYIWLFVGR